MNLGRFDHLLHHRCIHCYQRGYLAAASEAKDRERNIKELLQQGHDPWDVERKFREFMTASERWPA